MARKVGYRDNSPLRLRGCRCCDNCKTDRRSSSNHKIGGSPFRAEHDAQREVDDEEFPVVVRPPAVLLHRRRARMLVDRIRVVK
jgi:hypothetical protein